MDTRDSEAALVRWRRRARAALPAADPDMVEEIAQHVTERWMRACAGLGRGHGATARTPVSVDEYRAQLQNRAPER